MTSKFFVGTVAAGCLAAAGAGGYMAVRSSATGSAAPAYAPASELASTTREAAPAAPPAEGLPLPSSNRPETVARRLTREAPARTSQAPAPRSEAAPREMSLPSAPAQASQPVDQIETQSSSAEISPATKPAADAPVSTSRVAVEEFEIPAEAVVGIRLESPVSSETAAVEDQVAGLVTRDVKVDGHTLVPAGSRITGHVSAVTRGGKVRERSRIGIRFTAIHVNDRRIPIETETIFRDGEAPGREATAKIGGSAVVGSILGGVFGGKKGAAIGGAAGAAGGTAVVMTGQRNAATIAAGTPLTVRLASPVRIALDR